MHPHIKSMLEGVVLTSPALRVKPAHPIVGVTFISKQHLPCMHFPTLLSKLRYQQQIIPKHTYIHVEVPMCSEIYIKLTTIT